MGEIAWFPTAWLSPYITWEARDDRSAVASISHGGTRATATLYFDDADRIVNFSAMAIDCSKMGIRSIGGRRP
jgi:hypothetical protein